MLATIVTACADQSPSITGVLGQTINTSFRLRTDLASTDGVAPAGHLLLVPDGPVYRVASHDRAAALAVARPDSAELLISSGS